MPSRRFFFIKNKTSGKYHRGATYGGTWGQLPQFFSRRRDAEYRLADLKSRASGYGRMTEPPDDIVILETKITWDE